MESIKDLGRQVIKNNDKAADTIYQRKPGSAEMIAPVMKQLVMFTELLVQSGKVNSNNADKLQKWQSDFARLAAANEAGDLILAADIMHHDLNKQIDEWIK